jgi:hypothetical protein
MKYLKAVMAISLITFSYGCGGPHVTGSDPASTSGSESAGTSSVTNSGEGVEPIADETTPPDEETLTGETNEIEIVDVVDESPIDPTPAPAPVAEETVASDGGNGGNGGNGSDGADGSNGSNGSNSDHSVAMADSGSNGDGGNGGAGGAGGAGTTGSSGDDGLNGAPGVAGLNGAPGAPGESAPAVVVAETPAPVIVPAPLPEVLVIPGANGTDGTDGTDGRDGRDADNGPYATTTVGLSEADLVTATTRYALPYLQRESGGRRDRMRLYTLGQGRTRNGAGSICTSRTANCAVKDAMVIFQVRVPLPARNSILASAPFDANMTLNIRKISNSRSGFDATESVCLLEAGACSGHYFMSLEQERAAGMRITARSFNWASLINNLFSSGQAMVNGLFSTDLATAAANHRVRNTIRYEIPSMAVNLARYFGRDGNDLNREQLMDLIYGNMDPTQGGIRTLTFVVSDDIMVIDADLVMTYSWQRSDASTPAASAE